MSLFPVNGGTNNNVQNAAFLAGLNPQQLLFGGSGLTTNSTLNGILSTLQTASLSGFSPDTFNSFALVNPFSPVGNNTGGVNAPNIFSGANLNVLTNTGLPNTTVPNVLTSTGLPNTTTPNVLTNTGNITDPSLANLGNLTAIQDPSQTPNLFGSNTLVTQAPLTGINGANNLITAPPTSLGQLGLGNSASVSGLMQVLTVLVQLLTQLGPALTNTQKGTGLPTDPEEDPLAKVNERIDELEKKNEELEKENEELRNKQNDEPPPPPPPTPAQGNDDNKDNGPLTTAQNLLRVFSSQDRIQDLINKIEAHSQSKGISGAPDGKVNKEEVVAYLNETDASGPGGGSETQQHTFNLAQLMDIFKHTEGQAAVDAQTLYTELQTLR